MLWSNTNPKTRDSDIVRPSTNIIRLRDNLPRNIPDILYHIIGNYHNVLFSLKQQSPDEYDPLRPFFSTLLKDLDEYDNFAQKFRAIRSKAPTAATHDKIYKEFNNYCQKNGITEHVGKIFKTLRTQFFWNEKLGKIVDPRKELTEPEDLKEARENVVWAEHPTKFDRNIFMYIIENRPLIDSFSDLMRSEVRSRQDRTTSAALAHEQPGSPGGDPHRFKQYVNAIIEHIDDRARRNELNEDEEDPERGTIIELDQWFDWVDAKKIPLLEKLRLGTLENTLRDLRDFGIISHTSEHSPGTGEPSDSGASSTIWVRLPEVLKDFIDQYDIKKLTIALLIHGYIRGLRKSTFVTSWSAYLATYFAAAIVIDHLEQDFKKANSDTRRLTSLLSTNTMKFRQLIWGLGLLISRIFSSMAADQFASDFSTDTKLRSFIAWQVSAVFFTNEITPNYRHPVLKRDYHLCDVYKNVMKAFYDFYIKYKGDVDVDV